jgi:hypothetical protein
VPKIDRSIKLGDWAVALSARDSWYITTACFADEPSLESFDGLDSPGKQIHPPAAALAETSPFAHQRRITEQSRFDREYIEPGHVGGRIATLEHEVWHREFGHAQESQLSELPSN